MRKLLNAIGVACAGITLVNGVIITAYTRMTTEVVGAYDIPHRISNGKLKKGLKEGNIVVIEGRYYEKYVVE